MLNCSQECGPCSDRYRAKSVLKRLFSIFGIPNTKEDAILKEMRRVVASQYIIRPRSVVLDRPFREFGRETGLQDELNYVEVILRLEKSFRIDLPDEIVLDKKKVGMESIPAAATPRWLAEIISARTGEAAAG